MLLPRFPPLQSGAAFSSPRVFHSRVFSRPDSASTIIKLFTTNENRLSALTTHEDTAFAFTIRLLSTSINNCGCSELEATSNKHLKWLTFQSEKACTSTGVASITESANTCVNNNNDNNAQTFQRRTINNTNRHIRPD